MSANFTSGWLGNGQAAWHNMGVVTEGSLPAREAFETADALFTVEKRELFFPRTTSDMGDEQLWQPTESFAVVRTDTKPCLVSSEAIRDRAERFAPSDGRVHPRRG